MEKKIIAGIIVVLVVIVAACGAYILLTDDSKADNDTYYFFIQMETGYDSEGLPYESNVMQEGFWIKASGDNANDALQNLCKNKDWKVAVTDMGGDSTGVYMSSLFGIDGITTPEGVYQYWATYVWDEEMKSFAYSSLTLDQIVSSDNPQYISLVYKQYTAGTDLPPTATPDDIPKDVL